MGGKKSTLITNTPSKEVGGGRRENAT